MRTKYVTTQLINGQKTYQVEHPLFKATLSEFGGQLLSFIDKNNNNWLWLSQKARLDGTKPIRGGIPICWPWFGPSTEQEQPQHGYARLANWGLVSIEEDELGVRLTLQPYFNLSTDSKLPKKLSNLSLFLELDLGESIKVHMHTENTSDAAVTFTQAVHTYFNVEDIKQCSVSGLADSQYLDQLTNQLKVQIDKLTVNEWIDRIYYSNEKPVTLEDHSTSKNSFKITGSGHDSVVVWNPWQDGEKTMSDFHENGYQEMVCIEMANTKEIELQPRQSHTLTQVIERI